MRQRDVSFTVALCASLALHAVLSVAVAEMYVREIGGRIWLPAFARAQPSNAEATALPQFEEDPTRRLGAGEGTGYAIDASPGDEVMLARQGALDQPFLSRDPEGAGRVGDPPVEWTAPPGEGGGEVQRSLPAPAFAAPEAIAVVGIASESVSMPTIADRRDSPIAPEDAGDSQPSQAAVAKLASPRPATHAGNEQASRPGPPTSADPAPQGESELDPFAAIGSLDFRSGRTVVRAGRKHKLVRPRITLDAKIDLATLRSTALVLRLQLDVAGNVMRAEVARSSGSDSLDQIFKVVAYEWWFEPLERAENDSGPETFLFAILID